MVRRIPPSGGRTRNRGTSGLQSLRNRLPLSRRRTCNVCSVPIDRMTDRPADRGPRTQAATPFPHQSGDCFALLATASSRRALHPGSPRTWKRLPMSRIPWATCCRIGPSASCRIPSSDRAICRTEQPEHPAAQRWSTRSAPTAGRRRSSSSPSGSPHRKAAPSLSPWQNRISIVKGEP